MVWEVYGTEKAGKNVGRRESNIATFETKAEAEAYLQQRDRKGRPITSGLGYNSVGIREVQQSTPIGTIVSAPSGRSVSVGQMKVKEKLREQAQDKIKSGQQISTAEAQALGVSAKDVNKQINTKSLSVTYRIRGNPPPTGEFYIDGVKYDATPELQSTRTLLDGQSNNINISPSIKQNNQFSFQAPASSGSIITGNVQDPFGSYKQEQRFKEEEKKSLRVTGDYGQFEITGNIFERATEKAQLTNQLIAREQPTGDFNLKNTKMFLIGTTADLAIAGSNPKRITQSVATGGIFKFGSKVAPKTTNVAGLVLLPFMVKGFASDVKEKGLRTTLVSTSVDVLGFGVGSKFATNPIRQSNNILNLNTGKSIDIKSYRFGKSEQPFLQIVDYGKPIIEKQDPFNFGTFKRVSSTEAKELPFAARPTRERLWFGQRSKSPIDINYISRRKGFNFPETKQNLIDVSKFLDVTKAQALSKNAPQFKSVFNVKKLVGYKAVSTQSLKRNNLASSIGMNKASAVTEMKLQAVYENKIVYRKTKPIIKKTITAKFREEDIRIASETRKDQDIFSDVILSKQDSYGTALNIFQSKPKSAKGIFSKARRVSNPTVELRQGLKNVEVTPFELGKEKTSDVFKFKTKQSIKTDMVEGIKSTSQTLVKPISQKEFSAAVYPKAGETYGKFDSLPQPKTTEQGNILQVTQAPTTRAVKPIITSRNILKPTKVSTVKQKVTLLSTNQKETTTTTKKQKLFQDLEVSPVVTDTPRQNQFYSSLSGVSSIQRQGSFNFQGMYLSQSQFNKNIQKQNPIVDTTPKIDQSQKQDVIQDIISIPRQIQTPRRDLKYDIPEPPTIPKIPFILPKDSIYGKQKKTRRGRLRFAKFKPRYTASIGAVLFNIKGKRPKRITGLEVRPLDFGTKRKKKRDSK